MRKTRSCFRAVSFPLNGNLWSVELPYACVGVLHVKPGTHELERLHGLGPGFSFSFFEECSGAGVIDKHTLTTE